MSQLNPQKVFVTLAFGGIIAALLYFILPFISPGGESAPRGTNSAPLKSVIDVVTKSSPVNQTCGFLVKADCHVELSSPSFDCSKDDVDIRARLRRKLADLPSRPECQKEQSQLAAKCGNGCVFDYGSMLTIPTRIETEFVKESDLLCRIRASRSVKISSTCIASN